LYLRIQFFSLESTVKATTALGGGDDGNHRQDGSHRGVGMAADRDRPTEWIPAHNNKIRTISDRHRQAA
jgi:hypothetical protein